MSKKNLQKQRKLIQDQSKERNLNKEFSKQKEKLSLTDSMQKNTNNE